MPADSFLLLAAVIREHEGSCVRGRTRLQKTVKLLQSKGLDSDYMFTMHHYGPYCEEVFEDVEKLRAFGLVTEEENMTKEGDRAYFEVKLDKSPDTLPPLDQSMGKWIPILQDAPTEVLELAATYRAFLEGGSSHQEAIEKLKIKKDEKCTPENPEAMKKLLTQLELPTG